MSTLDDYDVDPDAFSLKNTLDQILATVVTVYESYNIPLPTRRYWVFGDPAIDCEQVVVSFVQLYLGAPGNQANAPRYCNEPRSVVVNIDISREAPVQSARGSNKPPKPEQIQSSAEWQAVDAWVLMESMKQFDSWGGFGGPGLGVIASVRSTPTEGAISTVSMNLTVAVA